MFGNTHKIIQNILHQAAIPRAKFMKQWCLIPKINQIFIYRFKQEKKSLKGKANKPFPLSPLPFLVASFIFHPIAA
ncbi:MAG: hypothetical protein C4322_03000, partial [Mastigocladus sp. ERB_26_1]